MAYVFFRVKYASPSIRGLNLRSIILPSINPEQSSKSPSVPFAIVSCAYFILSPFGLIICDFDTDTNALRTRLKYKWIVPSPNLKSVDCYMVGIPRHPTRVKNTANWIAGWACLHRELFWNIQCPFIIFDISTKVLRVIRNRDLNYPPAARIISSDVGLHHWVAVPVASYTEHLEQ